MGAGERSLTRGRLIAGSGAKQEFFTMFFESLWSRSPLRLRSMRLAQSSAQAPLSDLALGSASQASNSLMLASFPNSAEMVMAGLLGESSAPRSRAPARHRA